MVHLIWSNFGEMIRSRIFLSLEESINPWSTTHQKTANRQNSFETKQSWCFDTEQSWSTFLTILIFIPENKRFDLHHIFITIYIYTLIWTCWLTLYVFISNYFIQAPVSFNMYLNLTFYKLKWFFFQVKFQTYQI